MYTKNNSCKNTALIISISSDIGMEMGRRWIDKGWRVYGTYRTKSVGLSYLSESGVKLFYCDLSDKNSLERFYLEVSSCRVKWDVLVICVGTQEPIGLFEKCDFDKWAESVGVNFINQVRIVHALLPFRRKGACVMLFAGGGTNNAPINYSAYIISKIALIKMCELLDAEMPDTRFAIVGPGWVKTKIHDATLNSAETAGSNYKRTVCKLNSNECTPMKKVLDCCDWIIESEREVVGGRNFSVVFDKWGTFELETLLRADTDMYKLRRKGNDKLIK